MCQKVNIRHEIPTIYNNKCLQKACYQFAEQYPSLVRKSLGAGPALGKQWSASLTLGPEMIFPAADRDAG